MANINPEMEALRSNQPKKYEAESKETASEQQEQQQETIDKVIEDGLDQAQTAANILTIDIHGKLQAIQNLGGVVKQQDRSLLLNIIQQGKTATVNLKNQLAQIASDENTDQNNSSSPSSLAPAN